MKSNHVYVMWNGLEKYTASAAHKLRIVDRNCNELCIVLFKNKGVPTDS